MSIKKISGSESGTQVVMHLEFLIRCTDETTGDDLPEFSPGDSSVKTAIRRAMGHLKKRPPKALKSNKAKDVWMLGLEKKLAACCRHYRSDYPAGFLLDCLGAVEDSLKTHTVGDPRGYLDFLIDFFSKPELATSTEGLERFDDETI